MEVTILKCKLKESVEEGTFVYLEQRVHGREFEIRNPGNGVEHNVRKLCEVEVSKIVVPDEIDISDMVNAGDKKELVQFATDCWDLAIKQEKEISELRSELANKDIDETIASRTKTEPKKVAKTRKKKAE